MKAIIIISSISIFLIASCADSNGHEENQTVENNKDSLLYSINEEMLDSLNEINDQIIEQLSQPIEEPPICSDSITELLSEVESGNVAALKKYIQNGGDPMFQCYDNTGPTNSLRSLFNYVKWSESYDMIAYYLSLTIEQNQKDELLSFFSYNLNHDRITRLVIKNNGRLSDFTQGCMQIKADQYSYLIRLGYDVNGADPDGITDLMNYAMCPCPDGAEVIVGSMKYLVHNGADPTIQSGSGKTALDFATHPDIIAYLKSLK